MRVGSNSLENEDSSRTSDIKKCNRVKLMEETELLKEMFDNVIVVDSISKREVDIAEFKTELSKRSCSRTCPLALDKTGCICSEAISNKEAISRFMVDGRKAYFVISKPIQLGNRILNAVAIKRVNSRFSFGTSGVGEAVEEISNISSTLVIDQLTQIYNRKFLDDKSGYWVENAKSNNREMCLASIDIDNFKRFNDSYGHDFGDLVLTTLAKCMEEIIEGIHGMYPIRVGGDEFLVISTGGMTKKRFMVVMNNLCELVKSTKLKYGKEKVGITISIGTGCILEQHNETYKDLYNSADKALYMAKEAGKNCVR